MTMSKKNNRLYWLVPPLFVLVSLVIYANTFEAPFYLDDFRNITENISLRSEGLTLTDIAEAIRESPIKTRGISYLSFALNYHFHQYRVFGYHLVNTAIHAISAILLFYVLALTLRLPAAGKAYRYPRELAFIAALLWLTHPIQTQAVTYIVQRMTSMAAMFYLLAFLFFILGRLAAKGVKRTLLFLCCLAAWLLAMGSKEIAITLPFLLFLYEWYFFQDLDRAWLKRQMPVLLLPLLVLIALAFLYTDFNPLDTLLGYGRRDFTLSERVLTECRVFFFYLSLLLLPYPGRLSLEHDFSISKSLLDPATTGVSILALAAILVAAAALAKRKRLLSFCILWFVGNLILESSVFPLEILFEHRLYLPSMLFFLLLTVLAFQNYTSRRLIVALGLCLAFLLGFWTYQQNHIWSDPVLFWRSSVKNSPLNARARNNLGAALSHAGQDDEALEEIHRALSLMPDFVNAYVNLGNVYLRKRSFDQAIVNYQKALQLKPDYYGVYGNLGNAYFRKGDAAKALEAYNEALANDPGIVEARVNRGAIYAQRGFLQMAAEDFEKAAELSPEKADIHYNLGLLYMEINSLEKALAAFEKALRLKPSDKSAKQQVDRLKARLNPSGIKGM